MQDAAEASVPFFEDTRSIAEQLQVTEENWTPHKDESQPRTIYGLCTDRGKYHDDKYGNEPRPTLRLLTRDNTEWSVIGFHGYLRNEILRKNPQAGDFLGIAYKGVKAAAKSGDSDAYVYSLVLERNPNRPAATPAPSAAPIVTEAVVEPATDDAPPPLDNDIPF
jgi:hypothetical protein